VTSAYRASIAKKANACSFKWAVIEPDLFRGEDILFVADQDSLREAQEANPGLVTYLADELDLLPPASDTDALKTIHQLKKRFGGWMAPAAFFLA
jgi:hypothetical protein